MPKAGMGNKARKEVLAGDSMWYFAAADIVLFYCRK